MDVNKAYEEIARKIREIPADEPVSSYEWEELVQKMCDSDDAGLHDIGIKELGELKRRHPDNKKQDLKE
ncbi:MAG TPA: hypothetical protein VN642_14465 [Dongiaceae bacterium]|nr:hypothetical protein [Dongiaceae bacterium]